MEDRTTQLHGGYHCHLVKSLLNLTSPVRRSRLNLSDATDHQLSDLNKACKPASFGRDNQDVLDESYRKAGKLDLTEFATTFDLADTDIMDIVKSELVEGDKEIEKVVRAELYKLNVYGEYM